MRPWSPEPHDSVKYLRGKKFFGKKQLHNQYCVKRYLNIAHFGIHIPRGLENRTISAPQQGETTQYFSIELKST